MNNSTCNSSAAENIFVAAVRTVFAFVGLTNPIRFTVLTAPVGRILTKHYDKDPNGGLIKTPAAVFGRGTYRTVSIASMSEFPAFLNRATQRDAHLYGLFTSLDSGKIVAEAFRKAEDERSRTKRFIAYSATPTIVAFDIDAPQRGDPPSKDAVIDALVQVFPVLRTTTVVWSASASSCIYDRETGNALRKLTGQRVYFAIKDGRDLPRSFGVIIARLYLAGYGRIEISACGSLLERSLIDKAMATPTQPDFCGGASCGSGLEQRRPPAHTLWTGALLDSKLAFGDLSQDDRKQYDVMRKDDKAAMAEEAAAVREAWLAARKGEIAESILKRKGKTAADPQAAASAEQEAEMILDDAVENRGLAGDFVILLDDGTAHSVRHLLRHRDRYDGRLCRDPLENDYDGGRLVGKLYLSGKSPTLYSLAHGGRTYVLIRHKAQIQIEAGGLAQCVDETMEVLREDPTLYSLGEALVRVEDDGYLHAFTPATLTQYLGSVIRYFTKSTDEEGIVQRRPVNPPLSIAKYLIESGHTRKFRDLTGVLTAPTMQPDGSLITARGYHAQTGLYLQPRGDDWPAVPLEPTHQQLASAFEIMWKPLSRFPWAGPVDRGVALAGQFTAIVRRTLRIAPGFGANAPSVSSGKTIFAQSLGVLSSGVDEPVTPYASAEDDTEMKKTLLSVALAGKNTLIIDNVLGIFENSALASAITGGSIEGRVLGVSKMSGTLPFRVLLCVTGNNMVLGGDLSQRILIARIDAQDERPYLRRFDFDPVAWTLEHRVEMVVAGLTLLQGFVRAGMPTMATGTSRFSDWDRLVRQAVLWCSRELALDFGDPLDALEEYRKQDPGRESLLELLELWHAEWGDTPLTVGELHSRLEEYEAERHFLRGKNELHNMTDTSRQFLDVFTAFGQGGRLPSARSIGNMLRFRADQLVDGYRLERSGKRHGNKQAWVVRNVPPEAAPV